MPLYERSVGFASVQSLCAFISGFLALLAPPVASTLSISTTFSKAHPSPRPAPPHLPPLSKVRCCRPKKFGRLPEGLLPIRTKPPKTSPSLSLFVMLTSVCTNMFSHPHYPTKTANTLASPRKRGGGTADTNFSLAVQYSDSPAFTILKLFRAVTVGIVSPHHHPSLAPNLPKPHYPSRFS